MNILKKSDNKEGTNVLIGGQRQANYDWMRVFAMCMVILNHVADYYYCIWEANGWTPSRTIYVYEGMSHFAVPLFLMLTGVFVIDKAGRTSPKEFYLKFLKKLGIPFVIFVLVYYAYDLINGRITWDGVYRSLYRGFTSTYAHWYVVMLAMIYALLPIVAFCKKHAEYKAYEKVCVAIFVWLMTSKHFNSSTVSWGYGNIYFLGYVLIGDVIHTRLKDKHCNAAALILIVVSVAISGTANLILRQIVIDGGSYYNTLFGYAGPWRIAATLIAFIGFTLLDIKKDPSIIAGASYTVYLVHKLIINILDDHTGFYGMIDSITNSNIKLMIPLAWIVIFVSALVVALIFNTLLNMIMKQERKLKNG